MVSKRVRHGENLQPDDPNMNLELNDPFVRVKARVQGNLN